MWVKWTMLKTKTGCGDIKFLNLSRFELVIVKKDSIFFDSLHSHGHILVEREKCTEESWDRLVKDVGRMC